MKKSNSELGYGIAIGIVIAAILLGISGIVVYLTAKIKYRVADAYIGGETLPKEMRVTGVDFYQTVRDMGFFKTMYYFAEKKENTSEYLIVCLFILPLIWLSAFFHAFITHVLIFVLVGLIIRSWRTQDDTLTQIGLCVPEKNFLYGIGFGLVGIIASLVVVGITGYFIAPEFLGNEALMKKMSKVSIGYLVSVVFQELILHGYFTNRIDSIRPNKHVTNALIVALIFGLIHLPNPVLSIGTALFAFGSAYFFLAISRNIYLLIFAHIILSQAIKYLVAKPLIGSGAMRVGPLFWQ